MPKNFEQLNKSEFQETEEFKAKKRKFFVNLGLRFLEPLRMHKEAGLWGEKGGKDDWRNVSEHCLVEAARAEVFADMLDISEDVKKDLIFSAVLHDFFKKGEITIYKEEGMTWDNYEKAEEKASEFMRKKGISARIIKLVGSIGNIGAIEVKSVLEKENLAEEDVAFLVLHYIDAYTSGSDWAVVAVAGEDGRVVNDVDRRQNSAGLKYGHLLESGRSRFGGEYPMAVEIRVDHSTERKISGMLKAVRGIDVAPEDLPCFIDDEIRKKIESTNIN
jgi:hypothetical protein